MLPPGFESKHIQFLNLNLSGVLDRQDAFVVRDPNSSQEESVGREDLNLGPTDNEKCEGLRWVDHVTFSFVTVTSHAEFRFLKSVSSNAIVRTSNHFVGERVTNAWSPRPRRLLTR